MPSIRNSMKTSSSLHNCRKNVFSDLKAQQVEMAMVESAMKSNIRQMVLEKQNDNELKDGSFLFASFNYFDNVPTSKLYIPAEFSACSFSLNKGVQSVFETKINPRKLIFGQAFNAKQLSVHTHRLPLPPGALGESNLRNLYENIYKYLRKCLNGKPLVVFTASQEMVVVKGCFDYLETKYKAANDQAKQKTLPPILVYDIEYLFFVLKKEVLRRSGQRFDNMDTIITNDYFRRDRFDQVTGIACTFHENVDRIKYCTRSKVVRWAYTFCAYMCSDLNITMEQGKHCPFK